MKILLVGLIACAASLAQPVLTVTAPVVRPGGTAALTITLAAASGPAVQFFLPQLPGISYSVAPGAALIAGKTLNCGVSLAATAPPLFGCVVTGGVTPLVDGVLAVLTFPAPAVGAYPMPVSSQIGATATGDPVPVTPGPPLILIVTTPCDVNGDGKTDGADVALSIQNAIARLITAALDLTGDGIINVVDVQRVINAANTGTCRAGA